jgi:hypothetical protein
MKASLLMNQRHVTGLGFMELVIWQLPQPVRASTHGFKYRLAFVVGGACVLRYDNEAGKGDHKHVRGQEVPYAFVSLDQLVDDFMADVAAWKG